VFQVPHDVATKFGTACLTADLGVGQTVRSYIAYDDNEPAGIASLVLSRSSAGIYNLATLPQHRGKGIAPALVRHTVAEATRAGHRLCVLYASPEAQRMYEALGFRCFSCVVDFKFEPPSP
jgi:ribosomal protein S18 acetylase RimI-like enzyme